MKDAAGQAVQYMNLMFGLNQTHFQSFAPNLNLDALLLSDPTASANAKTSPGGTATARVAEALADWRAQQS